VHFGVLKHFNSGNIVPGHSGSFSTMETAFPRVPPRNDPGRGGVRTAVTALWIRLCRYVDIRRDWDRRSANRYIRARAAEARLRHCGLLVAAAAS